MVKVPLHTFLRAHRKRRGLTLKAAADVIGIVESMLSLWETGVRAVDLVDLAKFVETYGVYSAVLLFAPEDGVDVEAMRQVVDLARRMGAEAAADWLRMGERIAPPK